MGKVTPGTVWSHRGTSELRVVIRLRDGPKQTVVVHRPITWTRRAMPRGTGLSFFVRDYAEVMLGGL